MKKILTLICFFALGISASAQNVLPNPGFENWTTVGTHMDPTNWNTLNPNTSIVGVLTCLKATGVDVHSGTAAIKLITKLVLGQNANGIATTGTISIAPPGIGGGVAYSGRPDSIVGWYKYTSVGGDNGFVEFQLLGSASATDTIGYVRFVTPNSTVSTYTRFSAPIVYRNANPVTNSIWILSSSAGFTATVNSTMFVDDLELITNSGSTIKELNAEFLTLAPNPVRDELQLENNRSGIVFKLYDCFGKQVFRDELVRGKNRIDLSLLQNGIYFYSAADESRGNIHQGKIVVAH